MPTQCWSSVRGRVARFTRLDACCRVLPAATPKAVVTTKGFVSVKYSPEISEPEETELLNADGEQCVTDPGCPALKWIALEISLCKVDPDLLNLLTTYPIVLDHAGNAVGNRVTGKISCDTGFAMEVWTRLPQQACTEGPAVSQHGYFLTPCVGQGVIGEFTIENGALTMTITAKTRAGSGWGVGPYDVDAADAIGTPGPLLTPIGEDEHMDMHVTTIDPPEPACGAVPMPAAA